MPSGSELAAIGLLPEDVEDRSEIEVFPENWLPMLVFMDCSRQWRVGAGGPIGLDYGILPFVFELHGVKKKKRLRVFDAVRMV